MKSKTQLVHLLSVRRWCAAILAMVAALAMVVVGLFAGTPAASAAPGDTVGLGTAASFGVLAGSTVTNTGPSIISGDLGVSPGSAITGFSGPPNGSVNGTQHAADDVALQAQDDLTTAYNDAAGRAASDLGSSELGGRILVAGVYNNATLGLTGTVTLDAQGDSNSVFIFQSGSTLITAPGSTVALINGALACNVFWQVTSSATLDTNTTFVGSILALTSATVQSGTTVDGRVLARNGAVTLDTNTITGPSCSPTTTTTTTPPTTTTTPPTTTTTPPTTTTTTPTTTTPTGTTTTPITTTAPVTTSAGNGGPGGPGNGGTTTAPITTTAPVTTSAGNGGPGGPGNGGTTTAPITTTAPVTTSAGNGGPGGAGNGGTTTAPITTTAPVTTSAGSGGPGGAGNGGTTTTTPAVTTTTTSAAGAGSGGSGGAGSGGAGSGGAGSGGSGGAGSGGAGSGGAGVGSGGAGTGGAGTGGAGVGVPAAGQVIPLGHPETGAGGAAHARDNLMVALGVIALMGAAGAMVPDLRRRRVSASGEAAGRHQARR